MMPIDDSIHGVRGLLALLAVLSVFETFLPFSSKRAWRRRHLVPNLALTALTLSLNLAFNAGLLLTAPLGTPAFAPLRCASLSPSVTTVLSILSLDAAAYVAHRLMHAVPPLWRAHRVHHSDPLVDVTTTLRFHPIETAWRFAFVATPSWLLGLSPHAVATYRVLSAFMAAFEHMNVELWQPVDTALSCVFGTPNLHKLHHSRAASETDTNYGNILSLFDRALGTFTPSAKLRVLDSGLAGYDGERSQRLGALLGMPFRRFR